MARIQFVDPDTFPEKELLKTAHEPDELPSELDQLLESSIRNVYLALANNKPATRTFREWMGTVWQEAGLTARHRELVILTAARSSDSSYEWHQHVRHAITAGISKAEIRAISADPSDPDLFEGFERAIIRYANGVCTGSVDDELYDSLANHATDDTVIGVTMLAAGYLGLARMLHALDVETEEEFVGWSLERLSTQ